jgi:regulator of protease activity HflC (stomatin/prohibitin superfamily)
MITGDSNLVELQATIRYVITAPAVYLFQVKDPEGTLRAIAESVLRETVAGQPFLGLLTTQRERFQQAALRRIRERCLQYGGLGIRVEGLALHDLHPPQEVVEDYHEVARAMEARDRQVNEAQAAAIRKNRDAQASALQLRAQAQAAANETIKQAEAAKVAFQARFRMRHRLSLADEWRLLRAAARACRAGQKPETVYQDYQRQRRECLTLQAALTDFRLFWDALAQALAGRDKVIIDADQVPGRRHLWLMEPDQFRVPVPLPSTERGAAPRGSRTESHGEGP